jgi:hypothetical protein
MSEMSETDEQLADEMNSGEEHFNPATGYIETTAHLEEGRSATPDAKPVDEDEEHYNPATGYIETTPHPDTV